MTDQSPTMKVDMVRDGHLGGFVRGGDPRTFDPVLWNALIEDYNLTSIIDVGCGEGYSSSYFAQKRLDVLAIDGSLEVNKKPYYKQIKIHDYAEGPYLPNKDYDLAWCCEFVEHVEEQYIPNFMATLKKAKIVAMTHALPGQGGYHHVNEQPPEYWIEKFGENGFDVDLIKSKHYRGIAEGIYFQRTGTIFIRR